MWFEFPRGLDFISIQLQEFRTEFLGMAVDKDGNEYEAHYFRAPDHFAPLILDIPGFKVAVPGEGAPEDLPKETPEKDNAISQLAARNDALLSENQELRARLEEMAAKCDSLVLRLHEAQTKYNNLRDGIKEDDDDEKKGD
jgi:hypothetical protein